MDWQDKTCEDCFFCVDRHCRRGPPQGAGIIAAYPPVAFCSDKDEDGSDVFAYSEACAEYQQNVTVDQDRSLGRAQVGGIESLP